MSILLIVLLPIFASLLPGILAKYIKGIHTGYFVLIVPVIASLYFLSLIQTVLHAPIIKHFAWMPSIGLNFDIRLDGLALLFTLLISIIGTLVVFYSIHYLHKEEALGRFYTYLLLFMGAMLGVVTSNNVLSLYLFWELTSISSFLLISFWYHKEKSTDGALKSMLITVFGGLMMLGGLSILIGITGTPVISEMFAQAANVQSHSLFTLAAVLILLAAFTKSAQFPFHIWLPDAMEAPTPVSAYLHSATMVKAGIYLIARFTPLFAVSNTWTYAIVIVGLFTMCFASIKAVNQIDLKGILAFSTVSQLGLIMSLLGIGSISLKAGHETAYYIAVTAAVFHILNHASFKGALFMLVGIIDHETGTRNIHKLNGLMFIMPITFTLTTLGVLSMAGVPPFNGFISKEMFLESVLLSTEHGLFNALLGWFLLLLMFVGSLFTFIYSLKLIKDVFLPNKIENKSEKKPHEAPILFLLSPIILISVMLVISVLPDMFRPLLQSATSAIVNDSVTLKHIHHFHGVNTPLLITMAIIIIGSVLLFFISKWQKIYQLWPEHVKLNTLYNIVLDQSQKLSYEVNRRLVYHSIRFSIVSIFSTLLMMSVYVFLKTDLSIYFESIANIRLYELILILIIVIATLMILKAQSRLFSIIMLSAIGYSIALLFVFFKAPDLALTQLSIETISTALFLMCFYHMPKKYRHAEEKKFKITNVIIAITTGTIVSLIALVAYSNKHFTSISEYYIKNVYDLAAGKNMVNVILVDFRGFDTLFESSVLAIAGIGIYTLIRLRKTRGEHNEETR
ncbi:Na+/H+ antiporter subunit A [Macrococcoides canis]|uniref:Na(+)/H(+) antiporter subunit A1 n=1 Tax=Macrococcoides canis TaxID=1855823 RepID=A0AAE6WZU5_9STAP|nr:Na+/H+ antiporter subunit A [Macrococcus canis]QIH77871.1 Na+/H+ antiporter subunit A [Macrococcus canis]UTH09947.1 Na+/H+ antiporter subunit A [Macrococcus canis]